MGQVLVITARVRVGNQVSPFSAPVVVTAGGVADNPLDAGEAGGTEADQLRGVDAPVQGVGAGDLSAVAATMKDAPGQGASAGDKSADGIGALGQSYTEPRTDSAAAGDKPTGGAWYTEAVKQGGLEGEAEADVYTPYTPPLSGAQVTGIGAVASVTGTSITPALPTSGITAGQPMYCFVWGSDSVSVVPAGWQKKNLGGNAFFWRRATGDAGDVAPAFTGLPSATYKGVVIALGGCSPAGIVYSTGTVGVAHNGSTVTGSGTAWNEAMIGCQITIAGVPYTISGVSSPTSLTIGTYAGTTISGAAYSIAMTSSVEAISASAGLNGAVSTAAITTMTNGALLLFAAFCGDSDTYNFSSADVTLGTPTGPATTQVVKSNGATGADAVGLGVWSGMQTTAGLTGTPQETCTTSGDTQNGLAIFLAITPGS